MTYIGLTDSDYDEKLREMGNYLWDLEQQADLARAEGRQAVVDQIESKILRNRWNYCRNSKISKFH